MTEPRKTDAPGRRPASVTFAVLALRRAARRAPFTVTLMAILLVTATLTRPVFGPHSAVRSLVATGFEPLLQEGRWWTPLSSVLFTDNLGELLLALAATAVLVGAAERLMGTWRTIFAYLVTAVAGAYAGVAVQAVIGWGNGFWMQHVIEHGSLDATRPLLSTVMVASAFAGTLWRRRIRTVVLLISLIFVLYSGHPSDLYRLAAVLIGLVLGRALRPNVRLMYWIRSSHHEIRVLLSSAVAITAVGPMVAVLASPRFGVLAPIAMLASGEVVPDRDDAQCHVLAVTQKCIRAFALDPLHHRGAVLGSAIPVVVLLFCAYHLLRGRRPALWAAVGLNAVLALWSLVYFGFLPAFGQGAAHIHHNLHYWRTDLALIASTLTPAATAMALVLLRRHFAVVPPRWKMSRLVSAVTGDPIAAGPGLLGEPARVRTLLRQGGDSMAHMVAWPGNSYWFDASGKAALAYRVVNSVALTTGGPFGHADAGVTALDEFAWFCDDNGWHPVFYSVDGSWERHFHAIGWKTLTVAEEAVIDLASWSLTGRKKQDLRTAINKAGRLGVSAVWTDYRALSLADQNELAEISEQWVADKKLPEMSFTLGGLGELDDPEVRLMLAITAEGHVHGVTSWMPSYRDGALVGYTLDFMRRRHDSVNGVMEFLIAKTAEQARAEGLAELSLSGMPLAHAGQPAASSSLNRALDVIGGLLEPRYGFSSLMRFKGKFQPDYRPLIMAYPDPSALGTIGVALVRAYLPTHSLRQVMRMLRVP